MSTKATIYSSEDPNIHIYHELPDGTVWVDLESTSVGFSIRLMTDQEWEKLIAEQQGRLFQNYKLLREENARLKAKIAEYEAFNAPLIRAYEGDNYPLPDPRNSMVEEYFSYWNNSKNEIVRLRAVLVNLADKKNYYYTVESTNFIDPDTKTIMPIYLYARKALGYEGGEK